MSETNDCRFVGAFIIKIYIFNLNRFDWRPELSRDRKWQIRITQIPCDCKARFPDVKEMHPAPAGCLQVSDFKYFFGFFNFHHKSIGQIMDLKSIICYKPRNTLKLRAPLSLAVSPWEIWQGVLVQLPWLCWQFGTLRTRRGIWMQRQSLHG